MCWCLGRRAGGGRKIATLYLHLFANPIHLMKQWPSFGKKEKIKKDMGMGETLEILSKVKDKTQAKARVLEYYSAILVTSGVAGDTEKAKALCVGNLETALDSILEGNKAMWTEVIAEIKENPALMTG